MMEILTPEFIAGVGFPIAITVFLLFRQEKVIKELSNSVTTNTDAIMKLILLIENKRCPYGKKI